MFLNYLEGIIKRFLVETVSIPCPPCTWKHRISGDRQQLLASLVPSPPLLMGFLILVK